MLRKKHHSNRGQALVEFALIIIVLLMIVFFIIEASRILWGWVTVQNAAREGARYASTGQFEGPDCVVDDLPKFNTKCDDLRVASVIDVTHDGLSGLPLNEDSGIFEDDNYYNIEVWGVDEYGQIQPDFAGIPEQPVIVRAYYRVPIITPFFRPIVPSIPVFGQVIVNNESFGQLGNANQGQGLPPPVPPIPTVGVTPSPTPSPTPTNTPTRGASPTPTATATGTGTPPSECPIRFVGSAVAGRRSVLVNGVVDTTATIINLTTGETLGADTLLDRPSDSRVCDGLADYDPPQLSQPLVAGHVLLAQSSDGSFDTTIVLAAPPTSTPTSTSTQAPTVAVTNTPTPTPTNTPSTPFIQLLPSCGSGPGVQFNVLGYNWPTTESVSLFWDTNQLESIISAGHPGFFQQNWSKSGLTDGVYQVRAVSASYTYSASFTVPCDDATPMPATAEPSPTPAPADLIVVGPPRLISTRPIIAYRPVQFGVTISNTGDIDVNSQFFVDLYFDPTVVISTGIPISQSVGYMAVSSLAGGASRAITITAPLGFKNQPRNHLAYGMVDSIKQVFEDDETNNVSTPFGIDYVTPAPTPTPTATPDASGVDTISGVVRSRDIDWLPQFRALVKLVDEPTSQVVATTLTDQNGFYQFTNVPAGTYTVSACITVNNTTVSGLRTGITPPNPYVDIFMLPGPCP